MAMPLETVKKHQENPTIRLLGPDSLNRQLLHILALAIENEKPKTLTTLERLILTTADTLDTQKEE